MADKILATTVLHQIIICPPNKGGKINMSVNMSIGSMNVNFIRVLFLQMGHSNHSLGVFDGIFKFGSYLAIHFDLSPSADDRRSAKRDADTLCKLRGHLFLIPRRAPNK